MQLGDDAGVVVEVLRRARREPARLRDRHARVEHLDADEVVGALADEARDAAQDAGPVGRRESRPGPLVEGAASGRDGGVDVLRLAVGRERDDLVGRRVARLERAARAARAKGPVDVVTLQRERRMAVGRRHGRCLFLTHAVGLPGQAAQARRPIISTF